MRQFPKPRSPIASMPNLAARGRPEKLFIGTFENPSYYWCGCGAQIREGETHFAPGSKVNPCCPFCLSRVESFYHKGGTFKVLKKKGRA